MKKTALVLGIVLTMVLMSMSAYAAIPYYIFGMAGRGFIYTNSSVTTTMKLNSFHATSETWYLFIENDINDEAPYDNITLRVDCTSGDIATFSTLEYDTWVDDGYINLPLTFESDESSISYNSISLDAKTVECDFTIISINQTNNTSPYVRRYIQLIPYYTTIEFVKCTGFDDNFGIQVSGHITSFVTMMEDSWSIAWYAYSIFIIIFAVIGIPILIFIILRWGIYRLTGHKLIERRER